MTLAAMSSDAMSAIRVASVSVGTRRLLVFFAVGAVSIALLPLAGAPRNDALMYMRQATQPFTFTHAPWGFHFGAPLIAWQLPLSPKVGLAALTVVGLAGTAAVLRAPQWFALL